MIGNSPHKLGENKLPFIHLKNLIYWVSVTLIFIIVSRICVFITNSWTAS